MTIFRIPAIIAIVSMDLPSIDHPYATKITKEYVKLVEEYIIDIEKPDNDGS